MEQRELIHQATQLVNQASSQRAAARPEDATRSLVELRELLNAQPELEAGGPLFKPEDTNKT